MGGYKLKKILTIGYENTIILWSRYDFDFLSTTGDGTFLRIIFSTSDYSNDFSGDYHIEKE